ncbi:VapE domain-containing protein [Bacteroides rodentium]
MENIPVTTYRGFSTVSGETTFTQDMADIRNGKHAKLIIKIASLVAQGKVEEANRVKKQLPFRTLTANYRERRLAPSITRYNPVITLDIDDLEEGQLEQTRTLINEDLHTLGSFLSPKRHGYKLFVFMQTEYARHLYDRLRQGEVTYATLEEIHLKLYSAAKEHYEALLGVEVDGSGKDISRGYFMSFDPHAYINAALLEQISPLPARIIPPAKKENSPKKTPVETVHPLPASSAATPQDAKSQGAKPWEKLIFSKAVTAVKRTTRFRAGNRDNFLFALGNKCYSKGLDEQTAIRLAKNEFGQEYPDVESPLHNAYIYTDKTSEAATKKEEKKPVINQVMSFLEEHYGIRRNLILDRLEFMPYTPSADAGKGYRPMRGKDYNTLFVDLQIAGISCYQNFLRAVIDSNYAKEFNPYTDYLYALPPWDGTDYIARLADTLTTENRELWQKGFKRWIVGLVACALSDEDMNQLVIILYSEQGKGKSSWIRRLLPPEWKEYFYNGIIDPSNKDDARLLATRIIINMEEFEGVKPGELAALKRIIAQDNVTQRKAYDIEAFTLPRHCSFIASTNNRQCLQDIGGNRRFLPITVTGIDYHTPVNHPGIYAQALALLKGGFRYWYEGEEIEQLNKHNERHRMKDPVEENLFVFFRKPLPEDLQVKWLPASVILTKLSIFGKVQVNPHTQLVLVQALEKYGFGTRTNEQETTEYEVVDIQLYQ